MRNRKSRGLSEIVISVISVAFGLIILFYLIPTQIDDPSPIIPNSKTFPYVLASIFTLLSCVWFFNTARIRPSENKQSTSSRKLFVGIGIGLIFVFIGYLLSALGYIIGGVVATSCVVMAIEGERKWRMALGAGVAITATFVVVFGKLLNIELPPGVFSLL